MLQDETTGFIGKDKGNHPQPQNEEEMLIPPSSDGQFQIQGNTASLKTIKNNKQNHN